MGFVFEDRDRKEWFFKDDFLERVSMLQGEWCDPIRAMEAKGHKLVGADPAGQDWLAANGFDYVTVDDGRFASANENESKVLPLPDRLRVSPYLDAEESAAYVRKSVKAFYGWAERRNLKSARGSRRLLYTREQLDAALRGETTAPRRGRRR